MSCHTANNIDFLFFYFLHHRLGAFGLCPKFSWQMRFTLFQTSNLADDRFHLALMSFEVGSNQKVGFIQFWLTSQLSVNFMSG